jgi:hypothetical protein
MNGASTFAVRATDRIGGGTLFKNRLSTIKPKMSLF